MGFSAIYWINVFNEVLNFPKSIFKLKQRTVYGSDQGSQLFISDFIYLYNKLTHLSAFVAKANFTSLDVDPAMS